MEGWRGGGVVGAGGGAARWVGYVCLSALTEELSS